METKFFGVIRSNGGGGEWLDHTLSAASREIVAYKISDNKKTVGNCLESMPIIRIVEMTAKEA